MTHLRHMRHVELMELVRELLRRGYITVVEELKGGRASLAPNTMAVKSVREAAAVCMLIDEFYRLLESMGAVGRDRVMSREQLLELLG